jgi:sugar/nucleoside kinase (ribokinase family)
VIVVAGVTNLQFSVPVDGFPVDYAPVRYPQGQTGVRVAGVGYNVAAALAALGGGVRLATLAGGDLLGGAVEGELRARGLHGPWVIAGQETPRSVILHEPGGERMIWTDLRGLPQAPYPLGAFAAALHSADWAVIANIGFARPLLSVARDAGVPVAADVQAIDYLDDDYKRDWMTSAQVLFCSHERLPVRRRHGSRWCRTGTERPSWSWAAGRAARRSASGTAGSSGTCRRSRHAASPAPPGPATRSQRRSCTSTRHRRPTRRDRAGGHVRRVHGRRRARRERFPDRSPARRDGSGGAQRQLIAGHRAAQQLIQDSLRAGGGPPGVGGQTAAAGDERTGLASHRDITKRHGTSRKCHETATGTVDGRHEAVVVCGSIGEHDASRSRAGAPGAAACPAQSRSSGRRQKRALTDGPTLCSGTGSRPTPGGCSAVRAGVVKGSEVAQEPGPVVG